jgi:hypothetical protein
MTPCVLHSQFSKISDVALPFPLDFFAVPPDDGLHQRARPAVQAADAAARDAEALYLLVLDRVRAARTYGLGADPDQSDGAGSAVYPHPRREAAPAR